MGGDVDVFVDHGCHDGVSAGDGVVAEEQDGLAGGWDLDGACDHAFAGEFAFAFACEGDVGFESEADAVGVGGDGECGVVEAFDGVVAEPVVAGAEDAAYGPDDVCAVALDTQGVGE